MTVTPIKTRQEITDAFIANARPDSIVGQLFPQEFGPLIRVRPIRVWQCKKSCCTIQAPSKRFWYVRTPNGVSTHTSFRVAREVAFHLARALPQEVTA